MQIHTTEGNVVYVHLRSLETQLLSDRSHRYVVMELAKKRERYEVSPYSIPHILLREDLLLLKELNEGLPQSINAITDKKRREFWKNANALAYRLDEKSKAEWRRLLLALDGRLDQSSKRGLSVDENALGSILNNIDALRIIQQKLRTNGFSRSSHVFIGNMSLVYLVTKFETFLRRVLEMTFRLVPEILMTSQKSMSYEELLKLETRDDIKRQMIVKETQQIINQDIADIDNYLELKMKVKLSKFPDWKEFKERFYRRNILIHNEGMPNKLYRFKTGYEGEDVPMDVSSQYLQSSIQMFLDMASWIVRIFDRKFRPRYAVILNELHVNEKEKEASCQRSRKRKQRHDTSGN